MKRFLIALIILVIGIAGCQNDSSTNHRPTAVITVPEVIQTGVEVTLDGSQSTDADGDTLRFEWSLLGKPLYSEVQIYADSNTSTVKFRPDKPGYYLFSLVVNDGKTDSECIILSLSAVGTVSEQPVITVSQKIFEGKIGNEVMLDASECYLVNNTLDLEFSWTLVAVPDGSQITGLIKADQPQVSFVPDKLGIYLLRLTITKDQIVSEPATFKVEVPRKIYDLQATVLGPEQVQITWTTSVPTTTVVKYSTSYYNGLNQQVEDLSLVTEHSITLTDLQPQNHYYFLALSYDENGNEFASNSYGEFYTIVYDPSGQ